MEHKPYLMPKPESARFLSELEACIQNSGYKISKIYKIADWASTAREIYADQLNESTDPAFVSGFESHVWLLNYFFSNRSLILALEQEKSTIDDKMSTFDHVFAIKHEFRKMMKGCDGTILTLLNISNVPYFDFAGQQGILGTQKDGIFSPLEKGSYNGSWDFVYFKYVHCPEPDRISKEWDILEKIGIIDERNVVSRLDWESMKYQKTMVPPSECQK